MLISSERSNSFVKVNQVIYLISVVTVLSVAATFFWALFDADLSFISIDSSFRSFFIHRNAFGIAFISSALFMSQKLERKKLCALYVLTFFLVFFSTSRTAVLAYLVASSFLVHCLLKRYFVTFLNVFLCLFMMLGVSLHWNADLLRILVSGEELPYSSKYRGYEESTSERAILLAQSFKILKNNSFFGTRNLQERPVLNNKRMSPHNFILLNAMTYGVPYALLLVSLMLLVFINLNIYQKALMSVVVSFGVLQPYLDFFHLESALLIFVMIIFTHCVIQSSGIKE